MKWSRSFFSLGLAFALLAGVSCTTADGPTGVPEAQIEQQAQQIEQPAHLLGGVLGVVGGTVGGVLDLTGSILTAIVDVTGLLTCQEQKYAVTYQTVGSQGGTIKVGKHSLVIPRGALRQNVRIKAEQLRGPTNSVRFSPEGLQFQKPAVLALNYQNCSNVDVPKSVVYTTENLRVLEILRSLDLLKARIIAAPIDHFSRYAVAF
jgi:hypothetical protein